MLAWIDLFNSISTTISFTLVLIISYLNNHDKVQFVLIIGYVSWKFVPQIKGIVIYQECKSNHVSSLHKIFSVFHIFIYITDLHSLICICLCNFLWCHFIISMSCPDSHEALIQRHLDRQTHTHTFLFFISVITECSSAGTPFFITIILLIHWPLKNQGEVLSGFP